MPTQDTSKRKSYWKICSNCYSLQETNAYIRKNLFYTMIIGRNSYLTHREMFEQCLQPSDYLTNKELR